MDRPVSISIETSCRIGGVALGAGDALLEAVDFDASARHATQLVGTLKALLSGGGLAPADLDELYVSAGPGSFTGLRVGLTVARTLGRSLSGLRCVAVPTSCALVEAAMRLSWEYLGVVLAAKERSVYASVFGRDGDRIVPVLEPRIGSMDEFLAGAPRPLALVGEALRYCGFDGGDVRLLAPLGCDLHLPTAAGVWGAGRRLARDGRFTEARVLLPIYARKPEAVRLWQLRHGPDDQGAAGGR